MRKYVTSIIIGITFLSVGFYMIRRANEIGDRDAIERSVSGFVKRKWVYRGLNIELRDGRELVDILNSEMDCVVPGDSIFKVAGQNVCYVFKKDKKPIVVKYAYIK